MARKKTAQHAPDSEQLRLWRTRCDKARKLREDWWVKWKVDDLALAYSGCVDDPEYVNRFWPTIKTMRPGLLFASPSFRIASTLKSAGEIPRHNARLMEELLAAIARQEDQLSRAAQLALRQSFFSIGVLKTVYEPHSKANPRAGQPLYVLDDDGMPRLDGDGMPQVVLDPETMKEAKEPSHIVYDEEYAWRWVNSRNMLLPDQGPDMSRWTWIGEEITVPLDVAQDDERFPKALRAQLRPTPRRRPDGSPVSELSGWHSSAETTLDTEVSYVECYDFRKGVLYIYAEGQPFSSTHWLYCGALPDGVEAHPYSLLMFEPLIDPEPSPWPIPLTYNWLTLQNEYATRRKQMLQGAKRSARKVLYEEGTFADADEATKILQSNADMAAAMVTDLNRPPVVLTDPALPPAIAQDLMILGEDWRTTTGQTGARLSNADSDTATEALLVNQAANVRDLDARLAVADWLADAGKKMLQQLKQTMTIARLVKIRGLTESDLQQWMARLYGAEGLQMAQMVPNLRDSFIEQFGQARFLRVSREDLQLEADVTVNPVSAKAKTVDIERQQFLQFLELLTKAPHILQSRELLRLVGDYFEVVSDYLVDELFALGQRLAQQAAMHAQASGVNGGSGGTSTTGPVASGSPLVQATGGPTPTGLMASLLQMSGGR
jgi:hypothetical protein